VLEWLAPMLPKVGGVLVQAEDELASINQIIGASYGGIPSLTATSGPGLALMTESIGLAVAAEVPIVIVNVMRGGPSTGIPTKSEQADLNIAIYGLHGDAPHLVLAPTSVEDCLFTTQWAVYLAETLQTAAIVLSDQAMGQARAVIQRSAAISFIGQRERPVSLEAGQQYQRYAITASGVSPMAVPGMAGYAYTADGLTHAESGMPSSQAAHHAEQLDKRLRKLTGFDYGEHWAEISGDDDADTAIVTWGSCSGPVREALRRWQDAGGKARVVAMRLLSPAQPEQLALALAGVRRVLVVEQTHSGQFHRYLRAQYDLPGEVRALHHPGPLPVRPGEVFEQLANWS
jgi:2-oxoglutarate ferredoxin oxidoreductase subunit alpha